MVFMPEDPMSTQTTAPQHPAAAPRARPGDDPAGQTRFSRRGRGLPDRAALALQVSIIVSFVASSSAPTPLYPAYQAVWHYSAITTTVVFGVYALAVLGTLLTVGSLSDHIGRRPVLIWAFVFQAIAMIVFTTADGVPALLIARVFQGAATGAALGAAGAGMLDLNKARGTVANAVSPMIGTAVGAGLSGAIVQYLPLPRHLVYLVLLGVFVLQALGTAVMRETSPREPGALASLRPRIGVPPAARGPLITALPVLIAVWALLSFYGSLGPSVVALVTRSHAPSLGGLAMTALTTSGALTVFALRDAAPRTVMRYGTVAMFVGVGITLIGIEARSTAVFFAGTIVAGPGFGAGYTGAIRTVVPLAAPHERAGLLSSVYVVCYLAFGPPAVAGGVLAVHGGPLPAARDFSVAGMVLTAAALAAMVRSPRPERAAAQPPSR
jgi:MFS family permease